MFVDETFVQRVPDDKTMRVKAFGEHETDLRSLRSRELIGLRQRQLIPLRPKSLVGL